MHEKLLTSSTKFKRHSAKEGKKKEFCQVVSYLKLQPLQQVFANTTSPSSSIHFKIVFPDVCADLMTLTDNINSVLAAHDIK